MYEDAKIRELPATTTLQFVGVTLPDHWQPEFGDMRRTVSVTDADGDDYQLTVHPGVADALRRACLLTPQHLCTRLDVGYRDTADHGLQVVAVYWEG